MTTEKTATKTNHFTVTIAKPNEETYKEVRELCTNLGCPVKELVWYSLNLVLKDKSLQPKSFGLQR